MKTIEVLVLTSLLLFAFVGAASARDLEVRVAESRAADETGDGHTRLLPAELDRHVPLICLDSYQMVLAAAGEFRHIGDEVECRPIDRGLIRDFQE